VANNRESKKSVVYYKISRGSAQFITGQTNIQSNMCHPDNGTCGTVSQSGVYASSTSLEYQDADIALKNSSQRKRQRGTSWYSHLKPEQREAYLQRNREYKNRRKSQLAGCSNPHDKTDWAGCSNRKNRAGQSDSLLSQHTYMEVHDHMVSESEDAIYVPVNIFLLTKVISAPDNNVFSKLLVLMIIVNYGHQFY
jgi:hypothetical protein